MALEWPLTSAQVRTWLDVTDESSDDSLDQAVEAVVAYVPTVPGLAAFWVDEEFTPPADVILGAAMLANRWHERRGSALGSTGYTEFGTGTILRHDPDIARMLRLASFAPFGFGAPSLPVEEEEA
jgi:hypothetical protein